MRRAVALLLAALSGCTSRHAAEPAQRTPVRHDPPTVDAAPPAVADADVPDEASLGDAGSVPEAEAGAPGSAWCLEGLAAFEDDDCYLIPAPLQGRSSLLIYLHGVIAPTGDSQRQVQGIVARNAAARGYVALMPRGRRGLGPAPVQDWWSWPTTAENHRKYARAMVESWLEKKKRLETMMGRPFERTYLAGSSNGAFFATVLALNGEFPCDGFGAMSGGSRAGRTRATIRASSRPPFYIGYGTYDELKPHPLSLGELLKEARWSYKIAEHNTGHGARSVYLDEAFQYWTQTEPRP